MATVLAILSTLAGLGASLLMTILLFASAPNSTESQWATIRNWLIAIALAALVGLAGSVWLLMVKKPWHAAGVGTFPLLFSIIALIVIRNVQKQPHFVSRCSLARRTEFIMPYVATISSILFSGLASLFMITMLCLGGANSTPEQARQLKFWIISIITIGLLCLIGSIWALVLKRAWVATGIGLAPTLVCICAFIGIWRMGR